MLVKGPTEQFAIETTRTLKVSGAQSDGDDAVNTQLFFCRTDLLINYGKHVRITSDNPGAVSLVQN